MPEPVRVLHCWRDAIDTYIKEIQNDLVPKLSDTTYQVSDDLRKHGITYVSKKGDCIVLTFSSWPTDATEQLVFSPHGYDSLARQLIVESPSNRLLSFKNIDSKWFYWACD